MNKTIYLRDDEVPIWEKARELAGDKLSPIIVAALRNFVAEKEAQSRGYQRIVLKFEDSLDHGLPKVKAFYGRWIIDTKETLNVEHGQSNKRDRYSVAETAKGNVVVYTYTEGPDYSEDHKLLIYSSFQEAAADSMVNFAICDALSKRGVPVEELDI